MCLHWMAEWVPPYSSSSPLRTSQRQTLRHGQCDRRHVDKVTLSLATRNPATCPLSCTQSPWVDTHIHISILSLSIFSWTTLFNINLSPSSAPDKEKLFCSTFPCLMDLMELCCKIIRIGFIFRSCLDIYIINWSTFNWIQSDQYKILHFLNRVFHCKEVTPRAVSLVLLSFPLLFSWSIGMPPIKPPRCVRNKNSVVKYQL